MLSRILFAALALIPTFALAADVAIHDDGEKAVVTIDGKPFTEYRYSGYAKPILYPVLGPGQRPPDANRDTG